MNETTETEDWSPWWIGAVVSVYIMLDVGLRGPGNLQQNAPAFLGYLVGSTLALTILGGFIPWVYHKATRTPVKVSSIVSGIAALAALNLFVELAARQ